MFVNLMCLLQTDDDTNSGENNSIHNSTFGLILSRPILLYYKLENNIAQTS